MRLVRFFAVIAAVLAACASRSGQVTGPDDRLQAGRYTLARDADAGVLELRRDGCFALDLKARDFPPVPDLRSMEQWGDLSVEGRWRRFPGSPDDRTLVALEFAYPVPDAEAASFVLWVCLLETRFVMVRSIVERPIGSPLGRRDSWTLPR